MSDGRSQQRVNLGDRRRNGLSAPDAKLSNLKNNNSHIVCALIQSVRYEPESLPYKRMGTEKPKIFQSDVLKMGIFEMNHSHAETTVIFETEMFHASKGKKINYQRVLNTIDLMSL